jgi:Uma2 family endonuclease
VSTPAEVHLGQRMSWEEYTRLGDDVRAEYIDGRAVMTPSPSRRHQDASRRLAQALDEVVPPTHRVTLAWSWRVGHDEFVPDIMVHPQTDEDIRFTGLPALVVEVLSTNRGDDLVRKTAKYAAAGLTQYWILDPRDRVLDAYELLDNVYELRARLTDDEKGDIPFGIATAHLDLGQLLA